MGTFGVISLIEFDGNLIKRWAVERAVPLVE
jgi:hypothetical protein